MFGYCNLCRSVLFFVHKNSYLTGGEEMAFDYSRLRGKIREVCKTEKAFAGLIGISAITLTSKFAGKSDFTQKQIFEAVKVLNLTDEDIPMYFFCKQT